MKDPKQKKQIIFLSVLLLLLGVTLYYALRSGTGSNEPNVPAQKSSKTGSSSVAALKDLVIPRNPRRTGGKKEMPLQDIDPAIHLEKLAQFDPGTPLNARNMFSIEAPPPPTPDSVKTGRFQRHTPISTVESSNLNPGSGRLSVPPSVVINLKFFGFKLDPLEKKRQGFFADGDQIYLASEGDLVANRYRVVQIGDSSAEIEEVSSRTRRQISLVTQ